MTTDQSLREEFWAAPELQYLFNAASRGGQIDRYELGAIADWWLNKRKKDREEVKQMLLKEKWYVMNRATNIEVTAAELVNAVLDGVVEELNKEI